jgi:HlyD family secretion protein
MSKWALACAIVLMVSVGTAWRWTVAAKPSDDPPATPRVDPPATVRTAPAKAGQRRVVHSNVSKPTVILDIVPGGTRVKAGEVVVQLDPAPLQDALIEQQLKVESVSAGYQQARLRREVSEKAVEEYKEGILKNEWMELDHQIEELEAQVNAKTSPSANHRLQQALSRRWLLDKFTKDRRIKELIMEVEKERSEELASKANIQREKDREAEIQKQLARCKVTAPIDGTFEPAPYADDGTLVPGDLVQPHQRLGVVVSD